MVTRANAVRLTTDAPVLLVAVLISVALNPCSSLHNPTGCESLRLRGGAGAAAAAAGSGDLLKAGAQRRAELAKKAEPKENLGLVGGFFKGVGTISNKLGITGSTTRVVGGKIVVTKNPIQQLTSLIYAILHGIFIFFKSFVVPMKAQAGDGALETVSTKEEFDAALKAAGSRLVVVDFTASWCGPCQQIGPVFKQLAKEHKEVVFLKVDVDENKETAEECGVKSMPTFQFYRNSDKVDEFSGADEDRLRSLLNNYNYKAKFRVK